LWLGDLLQIFDDAVSLAYLLRRLFGVDGTAYPPSCLLVEQIRTMTDTRSASGERTAQILPRTQSAFQLDSFYFLPYNAAH
jgi:hypothetical protein